MRVPYAAKALARDLGTRYKNVKYAPHGDPDGFGVQRTVKFGGNPGKFLAKVLPHIDDSRIVDVSTEGAATLVTFSSRAVADSRDPFPFDAAEIVLNQNESSSDDPAGA